MKFQSKLSIPETEPELTWKNPLELSKCSHNAGNSFKAFFAINFGVHWSK
jgi:hypothetical protein